MSESNAVELDSLFAEKSLFAVFRDAPSFRSKRFNLWVCVCVAALLSLACAVHITDAPLRMKFQYPFADTFTLWANAGAALAGTILGFLVAGFAILCTVLRPQTMIALQKLKSEKYEGTELKLLFVSFVYVMVQYLALLLWSMFALIVGGKTGIAAMIGEALGHIHWLVPFILLHLIFVVWGTWLVALVLILKSFVFNLYEGLLLGLADAVDDYQRQKLAEVQTVKSATPNDP